MPRAVAPPPSGEFSITLTTPFPSTSSTSSTTATGPPNSTTSIIGEPNRPATIKITQHVGAQNQTLIQKEGSIEASDVNELFDLVRPMAGMPSSGKKDIYGCDTRMVLSTFEVQWDNLGEDDDPAGEQEATEENKQTFKDVLDSINALARQTAKNRTS